jgi:hypothetical protein
LHAPATALAERWPAVGRSGERDARTAGRIAATHALAGGEAKLLVVFCCENYDLAELGGRPGPELNAVDATQARGPVVRRGFPSSLPVA